MSSQFLERNLTSICKFSHWQYQTLLIVDYSFGNFYPKNLAQISLFTQHISFLFTLGSLLPTAERGVEVKLIQVFLEGGTKWIEYKSFANNVYERNTLNVVLIIIRANPLDIFILKQLTVYSDPSLKSASKARLDQWILRAYRELRRFSSLNSKIASPESSSSRTLSRECFDEK